MRSLLSGSVVALYSRWSRRSSSREISGRLPNQVLDELEADPVRAERGSEVVHEAADHVVREPVERRVVVDGMGVLGGEPGRLGLHGLHLDLEAAVVRPKGQLQRRVIAPRLAARGDGAVARRGGADAPP